MLRWREALRQEECEKHRVQRFNIDPVKAVSTFTFCKVNFVSITAHRFRLYRYVRYNILYVERTEYRSDKYSTGTTVQ